MSVEKKMLEGLPLPTGEAIVVLLPADFTSNPRSQTYHPAAVSFEKANRQELEMRFLTQPVLSLEQRSDEWFAPAMLITAALMAEHPLIVSVICGVISNHIFALYHNRSKPDVKLSFVCESSEARKHVLVDYSGPVEGLDKLEGIVREAINPREY